MAKTTVTELLSHKPLQLLGGKFHLAGQSLLHLFVMHIVNPAVVTTFSPSKPMIMSIRDLWQTGRQAGTRERTPFLTTESPL